MSGSGPWRSWRALALPGLLVYLGAWGVWAILLDRHPEYSDTMLHDATALWKAIVLRDRSLIEALAGPGYHPPLCYLPAVLLFLILGGPSLTVLRLTVLGQYLTAVWLAHDLGRRVAGPRAGLLGATMLGTFPLVLGWGRMGYMDMGLALMVLLWLRLLHGFDPESRASGARLGLGGGLGLLTKLAFPIFGVGPLLLVLATRVRRRRHLVSCAVAAAVALLVAGWWYALQWQAIVLNAGMSSDDRSALATLRALTLGVDGGPWLLALALVGSVVAWRWRTVPARDLALLSLAVWPALALLLRFHPQLRYAVPLYAVAAVLAGVCLQSALERLGARAGRLAAALLSLFLLGHVAWLGLRLRPPEPPREVTYPLSGFRVNDLGLLSPDRRSFDAYPRALQAIARRFRACLVVFTGPGPMETHEPRSLRLALETKVPVRLAESRRQLPPAPDTVCVLQVTDRPGQNTWRKEEGQPERVYAERCLTQAWFAGTTDRRLLAAFGPSPLGLRYEIYELPSATLSREPPRPEWCRLDARFPEMP